MKEQGFDVKVYGDGGYGNFEKIGVKTCKKWNDFINDECYSK